MEGIDPIVFDITEPRDIAQMMYAVNGINERHTRTLVGVVIMSDIPQVGDQIEDSLSVEVSDRIYQRRLQGPVRLLEVTNAVFYIILRLLTLGFKISV